TAFDVFSRLSDLSESKLTEERGADGKPFLRFSDEAQEFFIEWYSELCQDLRAGVFEHPALESHFAKYRSLMPGLALIFELIDAAARAFEPFDGFVSIGSTKLAAAWCQFLMQHAKRIYGLGLSAATLQAKTLATHLQKDDLPDKFTARDVYFKGWAGLNTAEAVAEPLELLDHLGWIRGAAITTGGRPTVIYTINPKIEGMKL